MLAVERLTACYGHIEALHEVSLHVAPGEVIAILGANGAGKSTLLKSISGLLRPRGGTVQLDGQPLEHLSPEAIARLGIVQILEGGANFPQLTVWQNLKMGAYLRKDADGLKQDLDWVFSLFPILKERRQQAANKLSGGEQQMLSIGKALMARPRMLMLDEPSMGLSPKMVGLVYEVIVEISRRGVTILLVEQNVHHALGVASRGYVLQNGRVTLEGTSRYLLDHARVLEAYLG